MRFLEALFGAGTWGTGGNIVAAGLLTGAAWLLRGPLGRRLGPYLARHIAPHVAAHLTRPAGFAEAAAQLTEHEFAELTAKWHDAHTAAPPPQTPAPTAPVVAAPAGPPPAPRRRPPEPAPPRPAPPAAPTPEGTTS